jgi:hypothetical protein
MEEVIGSIPIRSTNKSFGNIGLRHRHFVDGSSEGAEGCGSFCTSSCSINFNDFAGRPRGCKCQESCDSRNAASIPCNFDVDVERSQIRCEGMTEAVPANLFSNNSAPRQCGTNALLLDTVRTERLIPFESS